MKKIKKAIISVSNKKNLYLLLKNLAKFKIQLISSGKTFKEIKKLGFKCLEISKYTGSPEILDGRVKTLHPLIFGGILGRESDQKQMLEHKIDKIDMVICNLYPFKDAANKGVDLASLIEEIEAALEAGENTKAAGRGEKLSKLLN